MSSKKMQELPFFRIFFRWFESANSAIEGIVYAAKSEGHLRFHLFSTFIVLLFCFVIGVEKGEFAIITVVMLLVIAAEMFNTALESMVDLLTQEKRKAARITKDVSAGAVLILSGGAVVVGYLILWPHLVRIYSEGIRIHKHYPENIVLLAIIVNLLIIILIKAFGGRGLPLRGGLVSGHAATAFSVCVSITQLTTNRVFVIAGLILAIVVALSRLQHRIHSLREIVVGALIGSLVTKILFLVFY